MTLMRVVARPLLASVFVVGGAAALKDPGRRAQKAQPVADLINQSSSTPVSASTLVRANAAVHVGAGAALALGKAPRLSALTLAATMPATTYVGHHFWTETDPEARANQRTHFLKNLGLMGGLLLSSLDPDPHKKFIARRAKDRVVEASESVRSKLGD